MSESETETVQTIKEIKSQKKGKRKMNLWEEEKKRRSENFKNNALKARKQMCSEKKQINDYKNKMNALFFSSDWEPEADEEEIKQTLKQTKNKNKNYDNEEILKYLESQKYDINDKIQNLFALQEKWNNRIERLYQLKKQKIKHWRNEPIIITNDKPQKMENSMQDAILSKILNQ